jgi:hypothetical protein
VDRWLLVVSCGPQLPSGHVGGPVRGRARAGLLAGFTGRRRERVRRSCVIGGSPGVQSETVPGVMDQPPARAGAAHAAVPAGRKAVACGFAGR